MCYINNEHIKVTNSNRCLGVTFSSDLSYNNPINAITKKADSMLVFMC